MAGPELQILQAFATPIVTLRLPAADALNTELLSLFLAREAEGDRYRKRKKTPTQQINIFESEFDLFNWPEAPVQQLRGFCLNALGQAVVQLNDYSPEQQRLLPSLRLLVDSWFHVTRHGGYIGAHFHPMASWSGVYCVTPGETPALHPDSGALVFPDIHPAGTVYVDPGNVRLKAPFQSGNLLFKQKAGELLLFPSHLTHLTLPFYGRDVRVTVAFNCAFQRLPGTEFGF